MAGEALFYAIAATLGAVLTLVGLLAGFLMVWRGSPARRANGYLLLGIIGCVFAIVYGLILSVYLAGPLGLIFFVALLLVLATILFHYRRSRQQTLLWTLAVATERGLPLVPTLEAFADQVGRGQKWRVRQLIGLLKAGCSLPEALAEVRGLVPRRLLVLIRTGHETGALAEAFRTAAATRPLDMSGAGHLAGTTAYVAGVICFEFLIVVFFMLKIAPQFRKIFQDFGTTLPAMTVATMDAIKTLAPVAPLLAVLCQIAFVGGLLWFVLGGGWLVRGNRAAVLELLALVVGKERPLAQGIGILCDWFPSASTRRRLRRTQRDMAQGYDSWESLARHGVISGADMAVLQAAQRVGNLAWALREMAESNRRRLAYRLQILSQWLFPLAIIGLGLLVGVFVVSFFLPIVALIQRLA